jgi:hypothetical protein
LGPPLGMLWALAEKTGLCVLEHNSEKRVAVFRKDHAQTAT